MKLRRIFVSLILVALFLPGLPACAQYGGGGFGGGMGGGSSSSNDAPPAAPPPGSIGNPPPKMKPYKYFDGAVTDISGEVITVEQSVVVPGEKPMIVTKKFYLMPSTEFEPSGWKFNVKDKVRVLYDVKDDKFILKKAIKDKA